MEWFVLRWQLEVTFQEVRAHLGVETQPQWSDRAIALVRRDLWHASETFSMPGDEPEIRKVPAPLFNRLTESLNR